MFRSAFDHVRTARGVLLAVGAAAMAACDDGPSEPRVPEGLPDVESAVVIDTAGPIFRSLDVTLEHSGDIEVFYTPTGGGPVFRMRSAASSTTHEILLPRLHADTDYSFAVRSFDAGEASDSIHRGSFSTGMLPAELAALEYTVTGTSTFPLLMVPFRDPNGWDGQVAIESDGEIVWYLESAGGTLVAAPVPGTHDMVFIENGFPNDAGRNGIVRVSPEREIVALLDRSSHEFGHSHHDMVAIDDEHVLFLAFDPRTVRDTLVNGEAVWEWNTTTGAVEKKWSSWDFIDWDTERDPAAAPTGWLHANSISVGPRGNVVISFRTLSQVISIAPDFQSLEWRVGGPGSTVGMAEEDVFVNQHSAWELPGGRLLVFDNRGGGEPGEEFSRALELQVEQDTAYAVWQYQPEPPVSALLRGGVYRLDNGNTLTVFPAIPFEAHETTPDGTVVWNISGNASFTGTFRVAPWSSIAGEVEVEAMP